MKVVLLREHKRSLVILTLFLLFYTLPLFRYQTNMASYPGDPFTHAANLGWFCDHFFQGSHHIDYLFAPTGVNGAATYEHPLLSTISCLVKPMGIVAQYNFLTIIQITLIIFVSYWVSGKYIKNEWLKLSFVFIYGLGTFFIAKSHQHINLLSLIWSFPLIFTLFYRLDITSIKQIIVSFSALGIALSSTWINLPILFPLEAILLSRALYIAKPKKNYKKLIKNLLK